MSKKIVLAIDSFKGSASSLAVEEHVAKGIQAVVPDAECVLVPVADGGEGTVEAIVDARHGVYHEADVMGPLGQPVKARYGMIDNETIAVLEMSAASGITLVKKDELNPLRATTYGTGQMILDAINRGAKEIYMGIGGSATNDGGMGMAAALGAKFLDKNGNELEPVVTSLAQLERIDCSGIDPRVADVRFTILCDVTNPLCGPHGASHIFGGQKGADEEMKILLDSYLELYAACIERDLGVSVKDIPGAGAAGGLGAGMIAFTKAHKQSGIDAVLKLIRLEEQIGEADLVVTGEGRMDNQTAFGKAPVGVSCLAQKQNIPVVAVVGSRSLDTEAVYEKGISLILDIINEPMPLEEAMKNVDALTQNTGRMIGRLIKGWMR